MRQGAREREQSWAADAAAKEAAIIARTRTFQSVMQALEQAGGLAVESFPKVALAGNASAAVAVMTALKRDGKIALWDSQPRLFRSTGAERMKAVTGKALVTVECSWMPCSGLRR